MDQADGPDRQCDRDTGADERALTGFDDQILGAAQIHARIARMRSARERNVRIEAQQWHRRSHGEEVAHVVRHYAVLDFPSLRSPRVLDFPSLRSPRVSSRRCARPGYSIPVAALAPGTRFPVAALAPGNDVLYARGMTEGSRPDGVDARTAGAPRTIYAERLWVPLWWWPIAFGLTALLAAEIHMGAPGIRAWLPYVLLLPIPVWLLLWLSRHRVTVVQRSDGTELLVDRAHLPDRRRLAGRRGAAHREECCSRSAAGSGGVRATSGLGAAHGAVGAR